MTLRALLLAGLILVPAASAQDVASPAPAQAAETLVITSIQVNGLLTARVRRGAIVHLVGRGFPAPDAAGRAPPGLVVEVDGREAMIFDCSTEHVGLLVPREGTALGRVRVRVTRPDGGRAEVELELVEQGYSPCMPNGLSISGLSVNGEPTFWVVPGDTLEIVGSGWSGRDVAVDLSGCGLLLLGTTPERVVVRVRDAVAIGPSTLRLEVEGVGSVETPLLVVEPTASGERPTAPPSARRPLRARAAEPEPRLPADDEHDPLDTILAAFDATSCGFVHDAAGAGVEAKGTAPAVLPDGFRLRVSLLRDGVVVDTKQTPLRGSAWRASFGPLPEGLASGTYTLELHFELGKQPRLLARRFLARLGPEVAMRFEWILRIVPVGVVPE